MDIWRREKYVQAMSENKVNKNYRSDKKMLLLIDILKQTNKIQYDIDFCKMIDLRKQNLYRIKKGLSHFTAGHIENAVLRFGVDANWIFGIGDRIFMDNKKRHTQKSNNEKQLTI